MTKSWYQSKTMRGLAMMALGWIGLNFTAAVSGFLGMPAGTIETTANGLMATGMALAGFGRVVAKGSLSL